MTHDKAIEAALDAYYNDGDSNEEEHRKKMRRAVAAFLRGWEPSDNAVESVFGFNEDADMRDPLKEALARTADELEGK